MSENFDEAVAQGKDLAQAVLDERRERRVMRRAAVEALAQEPQAARPAGEAPRIRGELLDALGPPSPRVLIAEGDSWFDYPFTDVLKELEDNHGYDIESVSHKGDTIEEMAYSGGQLDDLIRALEKVIREGRIPDAVLLSGGGNDVAGDEFAFLLNHAASANPGLNDQVVQGVIDDRIRNAYITVLTSVSTVCEESLGAPLPVLVHGYGYAVPDGRGFWGGWGPLPGPWLEPGFFQKGYLNLAANTNTVMTLIDRFNTMISGLPALPGFEHVRYVNVRDSLSNAAQDYEDWWSDELHPTRRGFRAVADRFVAQLP
jgi:lysophospholipase L1-like esterase